jgi:hypothetical protein
VVTTIETITRASVAASKTTGTGRPRAKTWLFALAVAGAAVIGLSARRMRKTDRRREVVACNDARALADPVVAKFPRA